MQNSINRSPNDFQSGSHDRSHAFLMILGIPHRRSTIRTFSLRKGCFYFQQSSFAKNTTIMMVLFLVSTGGIHQSTCIANSTDCMENKYGIHFDLPGVLVASEVPGLQNQFAVSFELSAVVHPDQESTTGHWRLAVQPRGQIFKIIDYSPRTETECETVGSIERKASEEKSKSTNFGVALNYAKIASLNAARDQSTKQAQSIEYQAKAVKQTKVASSFINRGSGVHFKLARTADQVLDGEKSFQVILSAPNRWRSGLLDLTVVASDVRRKFNIGSARWEWISNNLRTQRFVVAVHREGDSEAKRLAEELVSQEKRLRSLDTIPDGGFFDPQFSKVVNQIRKKIGPTSFSKANSNWRNRILHQQVDPYDDEEFNSLPTDTRVTILDYLQARNHFLSLNCDRNDHSDNRFETTDFVDNAAPR